MEIASSCLKPANCKTVDADEVCAAAQSKPGIRVLVAGTENILDNLYFGAPRAHTGLASTTLLKWPAS